MELTIKNIESNIYQGKVSSINFFGTNGEFQILENHCDLISVLRSRDVSFIEENDQKKNKVNLKFGGLVKITNNKVVVLVW
jgi:F-type H+-transporting ATPase subunit epsilon